MPRQNRVTPFSQIVAVPDRGALMGNRGCLHGDQQNLIRQVCSEKRWIACLLDFKGRKRSLMTPGHYTELFFLDEATALAAGHRPCFECRRRDFDRFKAAWISGNPERGLDSNAPVTSIDRELHRDRLTPEKTQRTFQADPASLPDGVFIALSGDPHAYLWRKAKLLRWTPAGYVTGPAAWDPEQAVVLTPCSTVEAIRAGYVPAFHKSAANV